MIDLDEYLAKLQDWRRMIKLTCTDDDFWTVIAAPWFDEIAPSRAREYGIGCWQRFKEKGLVAQIFNCYCRWENRSGELIRSRDTLRDLFGYAIMMAIINRSDPIKMAWDDLWVLYQPSIDYEWLVQEVWESKIAMRETGFRALRLAFSCWSVSVMKVS